jgi:hypothetical protein
MLKSLIDVDDDDDDHDGGDDDDRMNETGRDDESDDETVDDDFEFIDHAETQPLPVSSSRSSSLPSSSPLTSSLSASLHGGGVPVHFELPAWFLNAVQPSMLHFAQRIGPQFAKIKSTVMKNWPDFGRYLNRMCLIPIISLPMVNRLNCFG